MKLVIDEPESEALRSWIAKRPEQVSSVVAAIEVRRALLRSLSGSEPEDLRLERAKTLIGSLGLLALDDKVVSAAGDLRPPAVRTLDAVHVATALTISDLEGVVTYDDRLTATARQAGLAVFRPGR